MAPLRAAPLLLFYWDSSKTPPIYYLKESEDLHEFLLEWLQLQLHALNTHSVITIRGSRSVIPLSLSSAPRPIEGERKGKYLFPNADS